MTGKLNDNEGDRPADRLSFAVLNNTGEKRGIITSKNHTCSVSDNGALR
jgi:hypothetical protein